MTPSRTCSVCPSCSQGCHSPITKYFARPLLQLSPANTIQLFRAAQLTVNYLLHVQDRLAADGAAALVGAAAHLGAATGLAAEGLCFSMPEATECGTSSL